MAATARAFVTGATGFLGLNLVEQLVAAGWHVVAMHRPSSDLTWLEPMGCELRNGDVTDAASVTAAMPAAVDAVFHVAGDTNLWKPNNARQDRINVEGTRNVVDAALSTGARKLVHTSSISVWGLQDGVLNEDAEKLGAESWINYHRSKYAAEVEVDRGVEAGLDAVTLNPAGIVGRYDTTGWAKFVERIHTGKLPGVPGGGTSFCHAVEVARAHIAAAERGKTGHYYLLGGVDATLLEFVAVIGARLGRKTPKRAVPASVLAAYARVCDWVGRIRSTEPLLTPEAVAMATRGIYCDDTKARTDLGYAPASLDVMVGDMIAWMRSAGLLDG